MSLTENLCMGCMGDNGGEAVCPICGYDSAQNNPINCLPTKFTINDRYIVGKVIAENGENITYIGWDKLKTNVVRIKEYFPKGCATRNPDKTISIVSGKEYPYNEGLLEFIEINRNIGKMEPQGIESVRDVFEENGTVYSINENISGITLREFLQKNGGSLKWEQARPLFLPVIETVKEMNKVGIIHRGISLDTIIVGRDGKLRLIDYSIKKLRITNDEIESQLFEGFAAIEQYEVMDMHTDGYTDVYGLAAVILNVLVGTTPPVATLRLQSDSMAIPSRVAEELPRHVLSALANGLQVLPKNRTKNMEVFKNELVYGEMAAAPQPAPKPKAQPTTAPTVKKSATTTASKTAKKPAPKQSNSAAKYAIISSACTAGVFIILALILALTVLKDQIFPKPATNNNNSSSAPVVETIGSGDSNIGTSSKTYSVPNFKGKYYSEIIQDEDYERFQFVIKEKNFSDKYAKGTIISQSVEEGASVAKGTKIEVVISLGPKEIKMPSVIGLTEDAAKMELLKQGFLYSNIDVLEKYDPDKKPGVIIEQEPQKGTSVSTDIGVTIYLNTYEG